MRTFHERHPACSDAKSSKSSIALVGSIVGLLASITKMSALPQSLPAMSRGHTGAIAPPNSLMDTVTSRTGPVPVRQCGSDGSAADDVRTTGGGRAAGFAAASSSSSRIAPGMYRASSPPPPGCSLACGRVAGRAEVGAAPASADVPRVTARTTAAGNVTVSTSWPVVGATLRDGPSLSIPPAAMARSCSTSVVFPAASPPSTSSFTGPPSLFVAAVGSPSPMFFDAVTGGRQ
mmetsp:Transcript_26539/g.82006  ORF Transcript_26539/g.82006 Transcript_26539/m.82006 type:complete len:233 (-) Transcript_26539:12-710(-)